MDAKCDCGWDWARECGREMVASKGGEPTDEVGEIGLDGARERLGVRWKELGAED